MDVQHSTVGARWTPPAHPATSKSYWRPSGTALVLLACALLISSWPFMGALTWLWDFWTNNAEYSHGVLMPIVCGYLIWSRREQLATMAFTGSWLGVALIMAAALVYWFGKMSTLHVVDNFGYWLLLVGLALALLGRRAFRVIVVPLSLLLLAIPLPNLLLNNLSLRLQLWSSQLGALIIRAFGISVLVQGNVLDLGNYKLEVAQACSGLRYLFPLLTIGVVMAYMYRGAWWKRVLIALSSLPLTLLMNGLRVGVIGLMVDRGGLALAEGFVHEFQGWAMFMLTAALMLGLLIWLHRIGGSTVSWRDAFGVETVAPRPRGSVARVSPVPVPFMAALGVIGAIVVVGEFVSSPKEVVPARAAFLAFPDRMDGWMGHRQGMEQQFIDALQLDDYIISDYQKPTDVPVNLYVAYYNAQHSSQAAHSPKSCLPAGGWVMTQIGSYTVPGVAVSGQPLTVNRAVMEQNGARQLIYYWFQQRGRVVTSEYADKWFLLWDSVRVHRSDGALVRLMTSIPTGTDVEAADRRLRDFAAPLATELPRFVPN